MACKNKLMKRNFFIIIACLISMEAFSQKKVVVARDGTGDFTTIQGALNSIPTNNKKPVNIFVMNGIYKEKIHLDSSKNLVTLIGEDKFNTVLTFDDHTGRVSPKG